MPADLRSMNGANNRDKTHCPHGHAYTDDNLLTADLKRGRRGCKACSYARTKMYRASAKQASDVE